MTLWEDLTGGQIYPLGFLQIDIAGHSKLQGTPAQLKAVKEILRRHVETIVVQNEGRLFKWEGDGGSFMFLVGTGEGYSNLALSAMKILRDLPNINDEIELKEKFTQPLSVRISCGTGNVSYDNDHGNMHGEFLNKFFKYERAISLLNTATVTRDVFDNLPAPLKQRFQFFKHSDELGLDLFKFQSPEAVTQDAEAAAQEAGGGTKSEVGQPPPSPVSEEACIRAIKEFLKTNENFREEVEVFRLVRQAPKLESVGNIMYLPPGQRPRETDRELFRRRRVIEEELRRKAAERLRNTINSPHAVLVGETAWISNSVVLRFKATDYIGINILSEGGSVPVPILSANALLFCGERRELYLHRRSPHSRTYPSCLHTVGGAYIPPGIDSVDDKYDLIATAQREVWEETGMHFLRNKNTRMLLSRESRTGFIQLVLLGVNVPPEEVEAKGTSREGDVDDVSFDELPGRLLSGEEIWCPSGLIHVLAWLGLGTPPLEQEASFGGYKARELFTAVLSKLQT